MNNEIKNVFDDGNTVLTAEVDEDISFDIQDPLDRRDIFVDPIADLIKGFREQRLSGKHKNTNLKRKRNRPKKNRKKK